MYLYLGIVRSFSLAPPPAAPDRTGKKLWAPFPMILASNPDRAVTVRERDPTYPGNDVPGGPRGALVDEVNGDSICDQIPLPHGHGSVNFRFSMIPSSLKFQVSGSPSGAGPIRKGNFPSHRSLKRKRGVGEHPESSRLSCLPRLRPLGPPISLPPNPSLALQASSIFVLIGRPGGASSKSSFRLDLQDLHLLLFGYGLDLLSKLVGQSLCLFKASSLVVFRDFLVLQ